ncbi:hypothetical protein [Yoonia sp. 2307UL14-13]|uniref:hypothetical protein n=1 Tax=Yoonia sp. 2307UL14-13 TaxID=3126506 RepID=UPI0030AEBC47
MLTISKQQMKQFEALCLGAFVREMKSHCCTLAPQTCASAGQDAVGRFASGAVDRAIAFGLETRYAITCFVEAELLLGWDMARDPQYAWVAEGLMRDGGEAARFPRFHDDLDEFYVASRALDAVYHNERLITLRDILDYARCPEGVAVTPELCLRLASRMAPLRVAVIEAGPVEALARSVMDQAVFLGINDRDDTLLLFAVHFEFGRYVLNNPLYPWIADALTGLPGGVDPQTGRLRRRLHAWLVAAIGDAETGGADAVS